MNAIPRTAAEPFDLHACAGTATPDREELWVIHTRDSSVMSEDTCSR